MDFATLCDRSTRCPRTHSQLSFDLAPGSAGCSQPSNLIGIYSRRWSPKSFAFCPSVPNARPDTLGNQ